MSIFGRLFGGAKAEDERKRADQLFADGRFFDAKNAYEEAAAARDATDALKKTCATRADECSDALARARMKEADDFLAHGDLVHARAALSDAMEVAGTQAVRREAEAKRERAEGKDARASAAEIDAPSDDDRIAVLAAQWEEAQQEEYDDYGEEFRDALVQMHKGEVQEARTALEAILEENREDEPVYLFLEVARARLRCEDEEGAAKALRTFLKRVPDEDRSEARLNAYVVLSQIAEKAGDEEKAIKQLNKAIEAMPDDPRTYLELGTYLRAKGHPEEAIELLDLAIGQTDPDQPVPELHQELGLAHRDAGNETKAIELLEQVIRYLVQRSVTNLWPGAALPLAELHEKHGNLARAADLYASLARGTDRANHLPYHVAAARVLAKLDLTDEARRMYTRAAALAEGNAEASTAIASELAKLDE